MGRAVLGGGEVGVGDCAGVGRRVGVWSRKLLRISYDGELERRCDG